MDQTITIEGYYAQRVTEETLYSLYSPDYLRKHYLPIEYVKPSVNSTLVQWLINRFPDKKQLIIRSCAEYQIGAMKDGRTIYYQINYDGVSSTGKVIRYKPDGHRDKSQGATWLHTILKRMGRLPGDYEIIQCAFGEHLLRLYSNRKVAYVEAEKTALFCSILMPEYLWLACGGKNNLTENTTIALRGRDVTIFPDTDTNGDTFREWSDRIKHYDFLWNTCTVSNILEEKATYEQKQRKIDIADYLLEL